MTAPAPADRALDAVGLVGQLAEHDRLRVVAALVLGAASPSEVAAATGLAADAVSTALTRLLRSGLVRAADGELRLDAGQFARAARAEAPRADPPVDGAADPAVARVLRAFLRDGRLAAVPAPGRKRHLVLEHLVRAFEPGVRYAEPEVDAVLRALVAPGGPDHAALRRHLVEEDLLAREGGQYWRTGGWVDV